MSKQKHPAEQSTTHEQKIAVPKTRGKNAAGQTNGAMEADVRKRGGKFEGTGQAPNTAQK